MATGGKTRRVRRLPWKQDAAEKVRGLVCVQVAHRDYKPSRHRKGVYQTFRRHRQGDTALAHLFTAFRDAAGVGGGRT